MMIFLKCFFRLFLILALSATLATQTGASELQSIRTSLDEGYTEGVNYAILEVLAQRLNVDLELRVAPFQRQLFFMQTGTIDIMIGLLKRPEREDYIHFASPPYKNRSDTVFFLRRNQPPGMIQSYEDLRKLRIGTITGAKYFPRFDKDYTLVKEGIPSLAANVDKLLLGRLDTLIAADATAIDMIYRLGKCDQVHMADFRYAGTKEVFVGISKKSPWMAERQRVEQVIRKMIEAGEFRRIMKAYYVEKNLPVPAM